MMVEKPPCPVHGARFMKKTWSNQYIENYQCTKCGISVQRKMEKPILAV